MSNSSSTQCACNDYLDVAYTTLKPARAVEWDDMITRNTQELLGLYELIS